MNASTGWLTAIGLMSGTSMDGIDVALIETDGEAVARFGPTGSRPYTEAESAAIAAAVGEARKVAGPKERPAALTAAEKAVTAAHGDAVERFLNENGIDRAGVDVIGFHGQTVLHRPDRGFTIQLGDGAALARRIGADVVSDFRSADMAAGGQGAPFVPVYHQALARASGLELPVVVVNIGGVSNVTWIGADADPIAFDTGPGNALLDDWVSAQTGARFDRDGKLALAGQVDQEVLVRLVEHPYFSAPAPKSLDRNFFSLESLSHLSVEDGAATLVAFTGAAIAFSQPFFPEEPRRWIIAGGGARNPAIMGELAARLEAPVITAEEVGWSVEHLEAQAFAFLAVRSLRGLPLTFPTTTGVREPVTGGVLSRGRRAG